MNNYPAGSLPKGKIIWGSVLAILLGALVPLAATLGVLALSPLLLIGGVVLVVLQCYGGWIPAGLYTGVSLAGSAWLLGAQPTLILTVAMFLPAAFALQGILLKQPFFEQLRASIIDHMAGLLAGLLVAYTAYGAGMVTKLMDGVRAQFALMPDAAFAPFVEMVNATLSGGLSGAGVVTVDTYRASIKGMLDLMERTYGQTLPGMLLCAALISAVLTVLWGNWRMALRGLATEQSFVGMSRWFLPANVSIGALVLWVVGYVLTLTSYAESATVYTTIYLVFRQIFSIQALASTDRRLIRRGMSTARRRTLLVLAFIAGQLFELMSLVLLVHGLASAMFGSNGALGKLKVIVHKDDDDNDDDDR